MSRWSTRDPELDESRLIAVGCEIAASLRRREHPVTLISDEPAPNAARLGDEVGERIAGWLTDEGVEMLIGHELQTVRRDGICVRLTAGGHQVTVPVAVMAAGVAPRAELTIAAGLEVRDGGASAPRHAPSRHPLPAAEGERVSWTT